MLAVSVCVCCVCVLCVCAVFAVFVCVVCAACCVCVCVMCVCLICVCSAVCACRAAAVGAAKPGATAALVAEPALSAGQQQEKERPASSSERAEGCEQTPAQDHREEGRPGKTSSRQRLSRQLPAVAVVAAAADWGKEMAAGTSRVAAYRGTAWSAALGRGRRGAAVVQ